MRNYKMTLAMLMMLGLLVGLAGCGGDDDDSPVVPATGDTMTLDNATAEQFTVQALDVVNVMVADVPTIAAGDFGAWSAGKAELAKAGTDEVTWDPAQNAWVLNFSGPLTEIELPSYWNINYDLWVQYRDAEGPMQYPLGATEMEFRYGLGMDMHLVEDTSTSDLTYEMNTNMVVSYLGEGANYGVVGNGSTVVEVNQVSPQGSQGGRFSMDWDVDVVTSEGGCPSGTATIRTQQFRLDAVYDGQGNVSWTLVGPNYQASGTDTMECGQPAF